MNYGLHIITNPLYAKPITAALSKGMRQTRVGLSDGSTWKARSGSNRGESKGAQTVLDMRGSNPLSRSKRFTRGRSINYKNIVICKN